MIKFPGKGLIEVWEPLNEIGPSLFKHQVSLVRSISEVSTSEINDKILTTSFNDEICKQEELVGGKGSSLAKLTDLKSNKVFMNFFIFERRNFLMLLILVYSTERILRNCECIQRTNQYQ